ncbi:MAG: tagaturonate epimerase family protein [Synergistaceae bacterium]|nr:tagaturonate epimerase family protein [Synergistaceae bacterium]
MKNYLDYIREGCAGRAEDFGIYPQSFNKIGSTTVMMATDGENDVIVAIGPSVGFAGERNYVAGREYTAAPLTWENGCVLRRLFPFTAHIRVLESKRSFGAGDRLGIATPGHIRAIRRYDARPVFAQQSMRELTLTERSYKDILDCASFAVFREGYRDGYGADGDHLKTADEIRAALSLGYSMITLDCCNQMHNEAESMTEAEVDARYVPDPEVERRYLSKSFDVEDGVTLAFNAPSLRRMSLVYGEMIDYAAKIYFELFAPGKYDADFEISIDETTTPTSPLEHFFVANELRGRGVRFATLAPRFVGEFQNGVDYIGNLEELQKQMHVHAAIARHFGYKLILHSGSDKFSVFTMYGHETHGNFHVKICGTNLLEAMKVAAIKEPALYSEIHRFALELLEEAKKHYHVTTDLSKVPNIDKLTDEELPALFTQNDARQLIHITYGPILTAKNIDGTPRFRGRLYRLWRKEREFYTKDIEKHVGRHLELLYVDMDGWPK